MDPSALLESTDFIRSANFRLAWTQHPATRKTLLPFFQGVVGLVAVGDGDAGEAFQEPFGMLRAPCGLVIVEYDGPVLVTFAAPVYPHITVGSGPAAVTDDLKRRFVGMNKTVIQQALVQFVVQGEKCSPAARIN